VNQSLFHYECITEIVCSEIPQLACPFPAEPILEGTVWGEDIAVLAFCFAQLLTRLTRITVTEFHNIQWWSFLQVVKILMMQQLCRHFPKITGGHGQPGLISRPEMLCVCIGWFLTSQALELLLGNLMEAFFGRVTPADGMRFCVVFPLPTYVH